MKFIKKIISKLPLILCGVFCLFITVQSTTVDQVLYFPLDTYLASNNSFDDSNSDTNENHYGEDYTGTDGETRIYAPISGTVIGSENTISGQVCDSSGGAIRMNGNYLKIQDDTDVYKVSLLHMQTGSVQFSTGDHVNAGDYIGNMSNTGYTWGKENSTRGDLNGDGTIGGYVCGYGFGVHVHVQLYVNDEIVNPADYWIRNRSGIPIKAETTSTSTCDLPDSATTFYIGELGNTDYETNNTTDPDATWSGVLAGEAVISGSNVTFSVRKTDGSDFSTSGTMYLKVGGYNSYSVNRGEPMAITAGVSGITFAVDDQTTHEWCTYSKDYYIRYEADAGGYTEVGPLTIEQIPALGRVANTDADYDGLDDDEETSLGTDPNNSDSDDDGLSDGFEVDEELNPLLADTDGDGINDGEAYRDIEDSDVPLSGACIVPSSGDWTIIENCSISSTKTAPANVRVEDGITLTISSTGSFNMDLSSHHITIGDDSRLIIEDGGKIY